LGEKRKAYKYLGGKSDGKRQLGRPLRRWVDNKKMDLLERRCVGVDWIVLAQDMDKSRAPVNALMTFAVP
jgi:hypothetical protein